MASLPNKDALCPLPLGDSQLDASNPSLLLFVLSALVKVLVVQAPPHQWLLEVSHDDCSSLSHGSIDGEEVKKCQKVIKDFSVMTSLI